jgi:ABC-2 type transport system ATP-binding protein
MVDPRTLEVMLHKGQNLNAIYQQLSACGIKVVSMRNKSNRLEQLFMSMLTRKAVA